MTIVETRQLILKYFEDNQNGFIHQANRMLKINDNKYQIKPDDAFYYANKVLLFEYENTKRPVESISKYWWLLKKINWLKEDIKIKFLITINNPKPNIIRTESIQILGEELKEKYPNNFDFHFISYSDLTPENIIAKLNEMIN